LLNSISQFWQRCGIEDTLSISQGDHDNENEYLLASQVPRRLFHLLKGRKREKNQACSAISLPSKDFRKGGEEQAVSHNDDMP